MRIREETGDSLENSREDQGVEHQTVPYLIIV